MTRDDDESLSDGYKHQKSSIVGCTPRRCALLLVH
jgi:hypothetical protein